MLAVSESLVEQGSWELPNKSLVQAIGVNGKHYSQYGPGQSLAAVPWVALGETLGRIVPKEQAGFPLRLVLASYNALIAAGICGLFAAAGLLLGYSRRASLLAAGVLAFCTFLWPHSRTFFSEPLVGLCLFASFYLLLLPTAPARLSSRRDALFLLLSGGLSAAALAVKVQYVVALIPFLVYLSWWALRGSRELRHLTDVSAPRRSILPLWWLLGLGVGLVPLFVYNLAFFGSPLATGYGSDLKSNFQTPLIEGALGLLVSPGKGLVWFAPPILLSILGFRSFARRHGAVALFVMLLAAAIVALFGMYTFWHGDGSWGPRYLVPLLPFALLPMLPVMQRAVGGASSVTPSERRATKLSRLAVPVLAALGFAVSVLGVLVNFDTYVNIQTDAEVRYWTFSGSPIVGNFDLLRQRLRPADWLVMLLHPPGTAILKSGFSYSGGSTAGSETLPRWTTGNGVIEVWPDLSRGPVSVTLRLADPRPPQLPRADVSILIGGQSVPIAHVPVMGASASADYSLPVGASPTVLTIHSDTWNPSRVQKGGRKEDLGVVLEGVTMSQGSQPGSYRVAEAMPVPPYSSQPRWYYNPDVKHPADLWIVYILEMGMQRGAIIALGLSLLAVGLLCLLAGWLGLRGAKD